MVKTEIEFDSRIGLQMAYCKVCLKEACEATHTSEEIQSADKKAEELKQALRQLVEYAKMLEEKE